MIFSTFNESSLFSTFKKVMLISAAVFVSCPVMGMEQGNDMAVGRSAGGRSVCIDHAGGGAGIGLSESAGMSSSQVESSKTVTPSLEDWVLGIFEGQLTSSLVEKNWDKVTDTFFKIVMIHEGKLEKKPYFETTISNQIKNLRLRILKRIREVQTAPEKETEWRLLNEYMRTAEQAEWRQESDELYRAEMQRFPNNSLLAKARIKFGNVSFLDFSGVSRLHNNGIKGRNAHVFITDPHGISSLKVLRLKYNLSSPACVGDHGTNLAGIIRTIAPKCDLSGGDWLVEAPEALIVCRPSSDVEGSPFSFKKCGEIPQNLYVLAAGNFGGPIIRLPLYDRFYSELKEDVSKTMSQHLQNMLFVTNMTAYGELHRNSGYPDEEFKDYTISTVGTDLALINRSESIERKSGTSFSTPIVAGVAALIKGRYPEFTPFDLKTCILESADQYIFENYGLNRNDVDRNDAGEIIRDEIGNARYSGRKTLDSLKYGKGILNANHALLYADILQIMHQRDLEIIANDERVKQKYLQVVAREESKMARKIQRRWKASHSS